MFTPEEIAAAEAQAIADQEAAKLVAANVAAKAKQPEPSPEPKKLTDEDLEAGLKDFLGDPGVSAEDKLSTQKGYNRLTDQAKAARETARLDAETERQTAKAEADKIRADAIKEAADISSIAIAKKMVKTGKWSKEQADEYLDGEGVEQGLDVDKILQRVAETTATELQKHQAATAKAIADAERKAALPYWQKAYRDIEAACPRLNEEEIFYFLGKESRAGVKPDDAVKAISQRFGSEAPPKPKNDTTVPDDVDKIAEERKKRYTS